MMAQLRSCSSVEDEAIRVTGFDAIIIDEQFAGELGGERLQSEDMPMDNLGPWSYSELYHDFSPGTSGNLASLTNTETDTKMEATIDSVINVNRTVLKGKESANTINSNPVVNISTNMGTKRSTRKKATIAQCEYCGVMTKHPSKIQAHLRTHTGEKPFECVICGMRFTQRTPMRMHVRRHLRETPFICSFGCGKSYVSNALKNAHEVKVHLKERRNMFSKPHIKPSLDCSSVNATVSSLPLDHSETQSHNRQPIGAVRCVTSATTNDKLDEVINAVAAGISLEPPRKVRRRPAVIAECGECGLILKHPSKIKAHMRIHTGERPFECQFCCMRFATANPLRVHLRRAHTGEKPFECTWDCGRRFVSISARNEHERVVHAGLKRYQCTIGDCRRLFTRRHYLRLHQKKDHDVEGVVLNCPDNCASFGRRRQNIDSRALTSSPLLSFSTSNRACQEPSIMKLRAVKVGLEEDEEFVTVEGFGVFEDLIDEGTLTGLVTRVENGQAYVWIGSRKEEASLNIKEIEFTLKIGNWLEIILLEGDRIIKCKQIHPVLECQASLSRKSEIMESVMNGEYNENEERFGGTNLSRIEDSVESYGYEISNEDLRGEAEVIIFEELSDDLHATNPFPLIDGHNSV